MVGALSEAKGPSEVLRVFSNREELYGPRGYVSISTRGLGPGRYRMTDVIDLTDSLLFVAQPGAGATLQFMKAGVLELPDLFAVNKSDLGALAERTARELEATISLSARAESDWRAPVVLCSARDGVGIDTLVDTLDAHFESQLQNGALARRRREGGVTLVLDALGRRYGSHGVERIGGEGALRARFEGASPNAPGFASLAALEAEIEAALRAPA